MNSYEWSRLTDVPFKPLPRWGFKLTVRNIRSEAYAATHLQNDKHMGMLKILQDAGKFVLLF